MLYYNNIDSTPLSIFRLVIDTGELKHLLIKGEYDENEALKNWMMLYDGYTLTVKSKTNNIVFSLKKQVYLLSGQYQIISNCLFAIQELYNCNLINMENKFDYDYFIRTINGYGFRFDITKSIPDELERVSKELKNKRSQILSLNKKIENYNTGSKQTFIDTISMIEKYLGFQIKETETMVSKFVSYLNQYLEHAKQHKDNRVNRRSR